MPGIYATAMRAVAEQGKWPHGLLTVSLHRNTMKNNFDRNDHSLNYLLVSTEASQASCHPNAIMFMNLVSQANYANDETPADQVVGDAARDNHVNPAKLAVMQNNKAIWVKYGAHSFVLLTGGHDRIESFEAWAGGNPANLSYYLFHRSVVEEPDSLGVPRVPNSRPTRTRAREALGWLLSDDFMERRAGVNRLSRAGHGGFGGDDEGSAVPSINIHIEDMVNENVFRTRLKSRLVEVGYYRQMAIQSQHPGRLYCCHCRRYVNSRADAGTSRWRECTHCHRNYCRECKHLLPFGFWGTITRTRKCECTQNTQRMY